MKVFIITLYMCSMLSACFITFFDRVNSDNSIYGHMNAEIAADVNNGEFSYILVLEKDHQFVGNTFGCWRLCNRVSKHTAYDAYVTKEKISNELKYYICVYDIYGRHKFDMTVVKNETSENYEIFVFGGNINTRSCIFTNVDQEKKPKFCCKFPGDELVKILQKEM